MSKRSRDGTTLSAPAPAAPAAPAPALSESLMPSLKVPKVIRGQSSRPAPFSSEQVGHDIPDGQLGPGQVQGGRTRRRTLKAKTLRRMLKKKGMKTTGKKSTLMKRLHMRGGWSSANAASVSGDVGTAASSPSASVGGRRRSRRRRRREE